MKVSAEISHIGVQIKEVGLILWWILYYYVEIDHSLYDFADIPLSKFSVNCGFISFYLYHLKVRGQIFGWCQTCSRKTFHAGKQCFLSFSLQKIDVANVFQETSHHPLIPRFKANWRLNLHVPHIRRRCFDFIFAQINYPFCSCVFGVIQQ